MSARASGNGMRKSDLTSGLIWFIGGLFFCMGSIQSGVGSLAKPGPGFTPFISGALLGLCGFILAVSSILEGLKVKEKLGREELGPKESRKAPLLVLLLAMFGYGLLMEPLGFAVTTFIFLFLLFKLAEPRAWLMPLILSVLTVSLSYLIFSTWLRFPFPRGIVGF